MKRIIPILCVFTMLCFSACTASNERDDAQVRVGQFLWSSDHAIITFFRNNEKINSLDLTYGALSDYLSLQAGTYRIQVMCNGELILEKEFGLGPKGVYTMLLAGIPQKNTPVNKKTTNDQLHNIVEGAATRTTNGYLPQLLIEDDFFVKESGSAKIRVVPLMPASTPLSVSFSKDENTTLSLANLQYPKSSDTKPIAEGNYTVNLEWEEVTKKWHEPLEIKADKMYTLFLIPGKGAYLTTPQIVKAVNE